MRDRTLFPWRAPLSTDWVQRWKESDTSVRAMAAGGDDSKTAADICIAVRRLANERLGQSEQLKLEGLARRMLPHSAKFKELRHFRLGLIGNRTLSFTINALRAAGLGRGLLLDAIEAPYDSIASFALGGADVFGGQNIDAAVIVLDEGAFSRPNALLDRAAEDKAVSEAVEFLKRIAAAAREQLGAPAIIATLPVESPTISSADIAIPGARARFVSRLNTEIAWGGESGDWIVWDMAGLASQIGYDHWFDPVRFHQAKTPFRIELCPLVADSLSRVVAAMTGLSARALILDLDNTLWGGVIGDDGLAGLRLAGC